MDYKAVLKQKNQDIADIRTSMSLNKIVIKDSAAILSAVKPQIREANRKGDGKLVSSLTKEQNLRRCLVTTMTAVNEENRQTLRETYTLRRALIAEWVAAEEA